MNVTGFGRLILRSLTDINSLKSRFWKQQQFWSTMTRTRVMVVELSHEEVLRFIG
jgi:hypothetical protein